MIIIGAYCPRRYFSIGLLAAGLCFLCPVAGKSAEPIEGAAQTDFSENLLRAGDVEAIGDLQFAPANSHGGFFAADALWPAKTFLISAAPALSPTPVQSPIHLLAKTLIQRSVAVGQRLHRIFAWPRLAKSAGGQARLAAVQSAAHISAIRGEWDGFRVPGANLGMTGALDETMEASPYPIERHQTAYTLNAKVLLSILRHEFGSRVFNGFEMLQLPSLEAVTEDQLRPLISQLKRQGRLIEFPEGLELTPDKKGYEEHIAGLLVAAESPLDPRGRILRDARHFVLSRSVAKRVVQKSIARMAAARETPIEEPSLTAVPEVRNSPVVAEEFTPRLYDLIRRVEKGDKSAESERDLLMARALSPLFIRVMRGRASVSEFEWELALSGRTRDRASRGRAAVIVGQMVRSGWLKSKPLSDELQLGSRNPLRDPMQVLEIKNGRFQRATVVVRRSDLFYHLMRRKQTVGVQAFADAAARRWQFLGAEGIEELIDTFHRIGWVEVQSGGLSYVEESREERLKSKESENASSPRLLAADAALTAARDQKWLLQAAARLLIPFFRGRGSVPREEFIARFGPGEKGEKFLTLSQRMNWVAVAGDNVMLRVVAVKPKIAAAPPAVPAEPASPVEDQAADAEGFRAALRSRLAITNMPWSRVRWLAEKHGIAEALIEEIVEGLRETIKRRGTTLALRFARRLPVPARPAAAEIPDEIADAQILSAREGSVRWLGSLGQRHPVMLARRARAYLNGLPRDARVEFFRLLSLLAERAQPLNDPFTVAVGQLGSDTIYELRRSENDEFGFFFLIQQRAPRAPDGTATREVLFIDGLSRAHRDERLAALLRLPEPAPELPQEAPALESPEEFRERAAPIVGPAPRVGVKDPSPKKLLAILKKQAAEGIFMLEEIPEFAKDWTSDQILDAFFALLEGPEPAIRELDRGLGREKGKDIYQIIPRQKKTRTKQAQNGQVESHLPPTSGEKVIRALLKKGYQKARSNGGSHVNLETIDSNGKRIVVTVNKTNGKDLADGTLRAIMRKTGLTREDLR